MASFTMSSAGPKTLRGSDNYLKLTHLVREAEELGPALKDLTVAVFGAASARIDDATGQLETPHAHHERRKTAMADLHWHLGERVALSVEAFAAHGAQAADDATPWRRTKVPYTPPAKLPKAMPKCPWTVLERAAKLAPGAPAPGPTTQRGTLVLEAERARLFFNTRTKELQLAAPRGWFLADMKRELDTSADAWFEDTHRRLLRVQRREQRQQQRHY